MAQENNAQASTSGISEHSAEYKANNIKFIGDTFINLKMGTVFHERLPEVLAENKSEATMAARFNMNEETGEKMLVRPKLLQSETGSYYLKGYEATLSRPDIPKEAEKTQFINVYKMKGFDIDQTRQLLDGGSVLNTVVEKGETRTRYTALNFEEKTKTGNYRKINVPKDQIDMIKLLGNGRLDVIGTPAEKEKMIQQLETGATVTVNSRTLDKIKIRLSAADKGIVARNMEGLVVKTAAMDVRTAEIVLEEFVGKKTGQGVDSVGKGEGAAQGTGKSTTRANGQDEGQGNRTVQKTANTVDKGQGKSIAQRLVNHTIKRTRGPKKSAA